MQAISSVYNVERQKKKPNGAQQFGVEIIECSWLKIKKPFEHFPLHLKMAKIKFAAKLFSHRIHTNTQRQL